MPPLPARARSRSLLPPPFEPLHPVRGRPPPLERNAAQRRLDSCAVFFASSCGNCSLSLSLSLFSPLDSLSLSLYAPRPLLRTRSRPALVDDNTSDSPVHPRHWITLSTRLSFSPRSGFSLMNRARRARTPAARCFNCYRFVVFFASLIGPSRFALTWRGRFARS